MGYADKLQKLCILRGLDQSTLAIKVNRSKSSISRILSGIQEPKLGLVHQLAKLLGVTVDYLAEDEAEFDPTHQLVMVTEDEMTILKLVRRLGPGVALDRLLNVPGGSLNLGKAAQPTPAAMREGELPHAEPAHEKVSGS